MQKSSKIPKLEGGHIPPHMHCIICGKAIPPDKIFCSKECAEKWRMRKKSERRSWLIWIAVMVGLFILFFVVPRIWHV